MVRRFDDHFMRADSIHTVEKTFALAIQAAFDSKRGKFIGHYTERPSWRVLTAAVAAVGEDFGRRLPFISRTERTCPVTFDLNAFANEIHGTLGAVRGNNHPAPCNGILAKFRQLSSCCWASAREAETPFISGF